MPPWPPPVHRVSAGRGIASAGLWVRPRADPAQLRLVTVAHACFGRHRQRRGPVRVAGHAARLEAVVALTEAGPFPADAALLAPPPEWSREAFAPLAGHLNRFCPNLPVIRPSAGRRPIYGRLVAQGWSGTLAYTFGPRRLVRQWLVAIEAGGDPSQRGQSGAPWLTLDGVAVGIQVGVLRQDARVAVITPAETVCALFRSGVAG